MFYLYCFIVQNYCRSLVGTTKSASYDFRIKAANALGAAAYVYLGGPLSSDASRYKVNVTLDVLIQTAKPKAVSDFEGIDNGDGTVTFTWANPNPSKSAPTYYNLYRTGTSNTWLAEPILIDAGDTSAADGVTSVT